MDKYTLLKDIFGHDVFRRGQEDIIDCLTAGGDVMAVMPTGGGKSVCYQIPALLLPGVTLVISPLISLMKDQVMSLVQSGVRAAYVNSSLTEGQYRKVISNMYSGTYKIIYVAPERLDSESFLNVCASMRISLVAVDEAHCVSAWGQDFRPAYLRIASFVSSLPVRPPVGAFTATATDRVRNDIVNLLELKNPMVKITGFDRPNLNFEVIETKKNEKNALLLELMKKRYADRCGIIYCGTRKAVEEVAELLKEKGYQAGAYHAGLSDAERHSTQDDFIYDRIRVMAATNAFGMGIDKSDVSFVIHYNMPKDVESYYQEAGRAGRDGSEADCVLMWSESDIILNRWLIENGEPAADADPEAVETARETAMKRLDRMTDYVRTRGCLRAYLLRYFGEEVRSESCGKCSNCSGNMEIEDVTEDAKKVISGFAVTGCRFGATTVAAVLLGHENDMILDRGLHNSPVFGIMKGRTEKHVFEIMDELRLSGYTYTETFDKYKIPQLTERALEVLEGNEKVYIRKKAAKPSRKAVKPAGRTKTQPQKQVPAAEPQEETPVITTEFGDIATASDKGTLIGELKDMRTSIAREKNIPAYMVFSDKTLDEMARIMPKDETELLTVSGIGKTKARQYGEKFIRVLDRYREK